MAQNYDEAVAQIKKKPFFVKVYGKDQIVHIEGQPLDIDEPDLIAGVYDPRSPNYSEEQVAFDIAMMGG